MWWSELIWWGITGIVLAGIYYYIHKHMLNWPFEWWNAYFIVIGINCSRYIFLLEHTPWAKIQPLKVAMVLMSFPLIFSLVNGLTLFLRYVEDNEFEQLTGHLPPVQMDAMNSFLWNEMIFFGVAAIISVPVLAIRLIISIWRTHNLNKA